MPEQIENTVLFQPLENGIRYGYFKANANRIDWHKTTTKHLLINEKINKLQYEYKNIIVLPSLDIMESCLTKNTVLIITAGNKNLIQLLYPELINNLWEVNEKISLKGNIDLKLSEPEINKALRHIFKTKPNKIFISLNNSIFNSLHERNLQNILNTAGYQSILSEIDA